MIHKRELSDSMIESGSSLFYLSSFFLSSATSQSLNSCDCLLYTSDAADELDGVDLGGRRIIKKKFFQAEDGIRDQPRSRGLGDVYKRQR